MAQWTKAHERAIKRRLAWQNTKNAIALAACIMATAGLTSVTMLAVWRLWQ